jgi:hypothetical protein
VSSADHAIDLLWQKVVEGVPDLRTKLSLKQGSFLCAGETEIFVVFASAFHHATVMTEEGKKMVEQAIMDAFGSAYTLQCLFVSQEDWQRLQGHFYTSREALAWAISRL